MAFNEYDKLLHFGISSIFGAASESYLHNKPHLHTPKRIVYATLIGIIPGIIKELYDSHQKNKSFDWKDMAANTSGALAGAIISNHVHTRVA